MLTSPVFPLNTVLFPGGRVPLKIFEPRYLDMITDCLKQDLGFTISLICEGSEVAPPGAKIAEIHPIGTYSKIVDWERLDNGLLGVIVEGERRVKINQPRVRDDNLMIADHDLLVEQPVRDSQDMRALALLLEELERHPLIERLGTKSDYNDPTAIIWSLCQLLPFSNEQKQILLESDDSEQRVVEMDKMLKDYQREVLAQHQ